MTDPAPFVPPLVSIALSSEPGSFIATPASVRLHLEDTYIIFYKTPHDAPWSLKSVNVVDDTHEQFTSDPPTAGGDVVVLYDVVRYNGSWGYTVTVTLDGDTVVTLPLATGDPDDPTPRIHNDVPDVP